MDALCRWSWPGNIRELENFIARSVILSSGKTLDAPISELRPLATSHEHVTTLKEAEREHIRKALEASNWVVAGPHGAAVRLGMKRTSLQYKMWKLGIIRPHRR
jgi:formate hydrogenlyase transcriptional activator